MHRSVLRRPPMQTKEPAAKNQTRFRGMGTKKKMWVLQRPLATYLPTERVRVEQITIDERLRLYRQNVNDSIGNPPTKSTAATHVQSLSPQPMRNQTDFQSAGLISFSIHDLRNDPRNTAPKNAPIPIRFPSSPDADEGAGGKQSNTFSFRGRGATKKKCSLTWAINIVYGHDIVARLSVQKIRAALSPERERLYR